MVLLLLLPGTLGLAEEFPCPRRRQPGPRVWLGGEETGPVPPLHRRGPGKYLWAGTEGTAFGIRCRRQGLDAIHHEGRAGGRLRVYALEVDQEGRIWAGHLNHGVSVFNGEKWRNYGLMDGPLGDRVFAIAVSPAMAMFGSRRTWAWPATRRHGGIGIITRGPPGLPSDQVQATRFNEDGELFAIAASAAVVTASRDRRL